MHLEKKIGEMIQNLIKVGVIGKCKRPWNSPLVGMGKKDGSI